MIWYDYIPVLQGILCDIPTWQIDHRTTILIMIWYDYIPVLHDSHFCAGV